MWTVSEAKLFRRCQKQWYYKHRFGSALATKVPARREAFVLSTFQTVEQWRGQVVDKVIEHVVVEALNQRRQLQLSELLREADAIFERQLTFARANRTREPGMTKSAAGTNFAALLAVEEEGGVSDEEVSRAREDVHRALTNLTKIPGLRDELRSARRVVAQNTFHFRFREEPIGAVPDLVAFYHDRPPLIIDWKVHFFGLRDARTQLLIYALGLCRSGKAGAGKERTWTECDIRTMEVQLLTGVVRSFALDPEAVAEMEEYMFSSMRAIEQAGGNKEWDQIDPSELPGILSDDGCTNCGFKPICWKGHHENHRN
jgi:hypothetical protein